MAQSRIDGIRSALVDNKAFNSTTAETVYNSTCAGLEGAISLVQQAVMGTSTSFTCNDSLVVRLLLRERKSDKVDMKGS